MILWNLNDCVGFSNVSGTPRTRRDRPWLRMNWRSQAVKLRRPREQATKSFVGANCERSITTSLEIQEWNDSTVCWAPEATASSVSQSGTEESNSLPVQSNSHTYTTLLSHIHYYTLSHTLLFSLTYTTILSHIHDYTLSYLHVKGV